MLWQAAHCYVSRATTFRPVVVASVNLIEISAGSLLLFLSRQKPLVVRGLAYFLPRYRFVLRPLDSCSPRSPSLPPTLERRKVAKDLLRQTSVSIVAVKFRIFFGKNIFLKVDSSKNIKQDVSGEN